ncbi:MAG: permease [Candidatus Pacebacteria bacterium]|jgi:hypothetical protein|nr:permease [Candidatus Paceibacterota bacterium]
MDIFSPIQTFADLAVNNWFGITSDYWASAINFFIYDTIKIGLLLVVINYLMAVVRYYLPVEKVRDILARGKWYGFDYFLAAMLGTVTPFCSCSSIPLFVGFVGAGIPLGVTFSFLIASPLVNEASLFIFPSIFGLKMTILYNGLGILISVLAGMAIQKLKLERSVNPDFLQYKTRQDAIRENGGRKVPLAKKIAIWRQDAWHITREIFPYVIMGVGIGALIHGFVPKEFVENNLSAADWWGVPLATLLGLPLYANSMSVLPIVEALTGKGVPLGTALAFMTSTVTLSIPGLLILKKAMDWKLISAFVVVTTIGIMVMGYFFNLVKI